MINTKKSYFIAAAIVLTIVFVVLMWEVAFDATKTHSSLSDAISVGVEQVEH